MGLFSTQTFTVKAMFNLALFNDLSKVEHEFKITIENV